MTEKPSGARFRLLVKDGSSQWEFYIEKKSFTFGRTAKSSVSVPLQILSSVHLEFIFEEGSKWFVHDKNTTNGTYLKSHKLEANKPYLLESPFVLRVGLKTNLTFEIYDLRVTSTRTVAKEASRTQGYSQNQKMNELSREEADSNQKEAYALSQRLESLRKEVSAAENKRAIIEKDAADLEREAEDKASQKKELESTLADLERRIALHSEQESDLRKSIELLKSETEDFRVQRESNRALFEEQLQKKERLEIECNEAERSLNELKEIYSQQDIKLKEALEKESQAHKELQQNLVQLSKMEEEAARSYENAERLNKDISDKRQILETLNLQLEGLRKNQQQEEKEYQLQTSKNQTLKETRQLLESQRKTSEVAVEALRTEVLLLESKLKRTQVESQEQEEKAQRLRSEVSSGMQAAEDLRVDFRKLEDSYKSLQVEHDRKLNALKEELAILTKEGKAKLEDELSVLKKKYTEWESAERDRVQAELKARRAESLAWENSEKERLKTLFVSKNEKQEKDLAERRQKELMAIEELKSQWSREREEKRPLEIKEIVRSAGAMLEVHSEKLNLGVEKQRQYIESYKQDLEGIVKAVLISGKAAQVENHLKAALVQSPDETLKAKKERKVWAIQVGAVAMLLLLGAIFPDIPRSLWDSGANVFHRDPQSADAFVKRIQEARANRPKFMPQRDRVFRNTYTDNLVYLQDYSEIKNDPDVKKAWTLELNKFFVQELDMDERIIVTFMAIEGPLVNDLTEMAQKIQIKTQESDISRMRAYEDMTTPRLIEVVKGRENYDKLRNFELNFYDEYSNKIIDLPQLRVPTEDKTQ